MDGVRIINYSNIFLSCFMDDASSHSNMVKEYYMGYIYAGEIVINENGAITKLHKGDAVFFRSDNRIGVIKQPEDGSGLRQYSCRFCGVFSANFMLDWTNDNFQQSHIPTGAFTHRFATSPSREKSTSSTF